MRRSSTASHPAYSQKIRLVIPNQLLHEISVRIWLTGPEHGVHRTNDPSLAIRRWTRVVTFRRYSNLDPDLNIVERSGVQRRNVAGNSTASSVPTLAASILAIM